jgi:hypothetical protein
MSDQESKHSSPDDLTKTQKKGNIELTEEELGSASGGLTFDGIKGESLDDKHKDEIHIISF